MQRAVYALCRKPDSRPVSRSGTRRVARPSPSHRAGVVRRPVQRIVHRLNDSAATAPRPVPRTATGPGRPRSPESISATMPRNCDVTYGSNTTVRRSESALRAPSSAVARATASDTTSAHRGRRIHAPHRRPKPVVTSFAVRCQRPDAGLGNGLDLDRAHSGGGSDRAAPHGIGVVGTLVADHPGVRGADARRARERRPTWRPRGPSTPDGRSQVANGQPRRVQRGRHGGRTVRTWRCRGPRPQHESIESSSSTPVQDMPVRPSSMTRTPRPSSTAETKCSTSPSCARTSVVSA